MDLFLVSIFIIWRTGFVSFRLNILVLCLSIWILDLSFGQVETCVRLAPLLCRFDYLLPGMFDFFDTAKWKSSVSRWFWWDSNLHFFSHFFKVFIKSEGTGVIEWRLPLSESTFATVLIISLPFNGVLQTTFCSNIKIYVGTWHSLTNIKGFFLFKTNWCWNLRAASVFFIIDLWHWYWYHYFILSFSVLSSDMHTS